MQPLGAKKRALQLEISAITAEFSGGRDHAVTRNVRPSAVAHDIADRPRGAWPSRRFSDITVCGDSSNGNAADDSENGGSEFSHV